MVANLEDFSLDLFDNGYIGRTRLVENKKVIGTDQKTRVFSHSPYAQEMFNIYNHPDNRIITKDLQRGDYVLIIDIPVVDKNHMVIELLGGLKIDIDLKREKRFLQIFGYENSEAFSEVLSRPEVKTNFLNQKLYAYITESYPSLKISLWEGHIKKTKDEFMDEVRNPSKAYVAKILNANRGGYFVEVQGVDAFMPGSLAAANKIADFQTLVGKEVIVMVEDFLKEMNSFIVSHKKYIEHILPQKLSEIELDKKYSGTVTGASKYGIFVEFGEIFTGLLHNSKMGASTLEKFERREYKPGDSIEFYIAEIAKDNRIILTEESPEEKKKKILDFIELNKDKSINAEVAAVMGFGVIVNIEGGLSGVVSNKEFKSKKINTKDFVNGDRLKVRFGTINEFDNKITFILE